MTEAASRTLAERVAIYRDERAPVFRRDLARFPAAESDDEAIECAALGSGPHGRRIPRLARLNGDAMAGCARRLRAAAAHLRTSESFWDLLLGVREVIRDVDGVGPVYAYDVALRIGQRLGLEPVSVHLHGTVRRSARALGTGFGRSWLWVEELPAELHGLPPRECEDFLDWSAL